MTPVNTVKDILPFNDFLVHLKRQGFIIGVDQYLRLQTLLNLLGSECEPSDLRTLLCPLFATNIKQQKQFYRAFDVYFKSFAPSTRKDVTAPPPKIEKLAPKSPRPIKARKSFYVTLGIIYIIAIFILSSWQQPVVKDPSTIETAPIEDPDVLDPGEAGPSQPQPVKPKPQTELDRTSLSKFYQEYYHTIRLTGILIPVTIFLFTELYRLNRQKLGLNLQKDKSPPFTWPIKIEKPELVFIKNEKFYTAARLLRQRLKSEVYRFNIDRTIRNTLESGGYPQPCYQRITKPAEYLVLIDRCSFRDHFAQLIKYLVDALANEDIIITHFFYSRNPRICFSEDGQDRQYLSDLRAKYRGYRLIIFGDGDEFIHPTTGDLDSWTSLFKTWHERAILTPTSIPDWVIREAALASEFILLPATIESFSELSWHFETSSKPDLRALKNEPAESAGINPDQINDTRALKAYLGNDLFQWLCACAVYPELYWGLTLYLGSLPCMPKDLITEKNLIRLLRLPWFKDGIIPGALRWELSIQLEKPKKKEVHSVIIDLLEKQTVPENTFAYDKTELNLALQRLVLLRKDRKKRSKIIKKIKSLHEKNNIQEYTSLKLLDSVPNSILSFAVPRGLRKVFFQKGIFAFGLKRVIRCGLAVLSALLVFFCIPEQIKEEQQVAPTIKLELSAEEITGPIIDPSRVAWTNLTFRAKNFMVDVIFNIRLSSISIEEADKFLMATPQGDPVKAESSRVYQIAVDQTLDSIVNPTVKVSETVWFNPWDGRGLGRVRVRQGEDDFQKIYRFTNQGVFSNSKEPANKKESQLSPEDWTDVRDTFYAYDIKQLGCKIVSERSILLYLAAAAKFSSGEDSRTFCVFGKRQVHRVQLNALRIESLKVNYMEKSGGAEVRKQGNIRALKIEMVAKPLGSDLKEMENFSLLGLQNNIAIFIDPESRLPVQISGEISKVGAVNLKLSNVNFIATKK